MSNTMNNSTKHRFLPDSSVILSGYLLDLIDTDQLYSALEIEDGFPIEFVYSRVVLAELENQANQDKSLGSIGVKLMKRLNDRIIELSKGNHFP